MLDSVVGLLEADINWNNILLIVIGYIFLLWFLLSFWVALDAKKRYKSIVVAIFLFLVVLILNIPALVFYLIVRPDREEDNILYLHSEESGLSGVNIPVVNFKGDDGFVISLQLKVGNPQSTKANNMNIDVNFDSDDANMERVEQVIEPVASDEISTSELPSGPNFINSKGFFKNRSAGILNVARKVKNKIQSSKVSAENESTNESSSDSNDTNESKDGQHSNQNKNHHKNHKKKKHRR
jgi:hypothetical protein